jgi:hypothetical protein
MTPVFLTGETASARGDAPDPTGPSGPKLLVDPGRVDSQPSAVWGRPVNESLWLRLDEQRRGKHEHLLRRYQAAELEVRNLAGKLEQQRAADERALDEAITGDRKPADAKAPAVEEKLERARERRQQIGELVVRSGRRLVEELDDAVVWQVIDEAKGEARACVDGVPAKAAEIREDLAAAGRIAREIAWMETLLRKRRTGPFRGGGGAPPGPHLAAAAEYAHRVELEVTEELRARERRRHPPAHTPPRGAIEVNRWPGPAA